MACTNATLQAPANFKGFIENAERHWLIQANLDNAVETVVNCVRNKNGETDNSQHGQAQYQSPLNQAEYLQSSWRWPERREQFRTSPLHHQNTQQQYRRHVFRVHLTHIQTYTQIHMCTYIHPDTNMARNHSKTANVHQGSLCILMSVGISYWDFL